MKITYLTINDKSWKKYRQKHTIFSANECFILKHLLINEYLCKSSLSRLVLPTGASLSPGLVSKAVKETFLLGIEDNVPGIFEILNKFLRF